MPRVLTVEKPKLKTVSEIKSRLQERRVYVDSELEHIKAERAERLERLIPEGLVRELEVEAEILEQLEAEIE